MSEFDIRMLWHNGIVMFLAGVLILVFAVIIYRRVHRKTDNSSDTGLGGESGTINLKQRSSKLPEDELKGKGGASL